MPSSVKAGKIQVE